MYGAILVAIALGIYGWRQTKENLWKRLAITLSLILVSAPFDELWHRIFVVAISIAIITSAVAAGLIEKFGGGFLKRYALIIPSGDSKSPSRHFSSRLSS